MRKEVKGRRKTPIDRCLERTPPSHEFTAHLVSNAVVEEVGRECVVEGVVVIEPKFALSAHREDGDLRIYAKLYCECLLKNSKKLLHEEMISVYPRPGANSAPNASASASLAQQELIRMCIEQRGEASGTQGVSDAYCPFQFTIPHKLPPSVSVFSRTSLELVYSVRYLLNIFAAYNASDGPEPSRSATFHIRRLALRELPYFVSADAAVRARRGTSNNGGAPPDEQLARRTPRRSGQYERIDNVALERVTATRPPRPTSVNTRAGDAPAATRPKSAPLCALENDASSPVRTGASVQTPGKSNENDNAKGNAAGEKAQTENPLAIASVPYSDLVRGNVRLECSLDRRIYWPTGSVCVNVLVDNDTDFTWKGIKLQLIQRVVIAYFGNSPKRKRYECVVDEVRTREAFPITHQAGWCKQYRLRPSVALPRRVTGAIDEDGLDVLDSQLESAGMNHARVGNALSHSSDHRRNPLDRAASIRAKPERVADCSSGLSRLLLPSFGANRKCKWLPALNGLLTDATSYEQLALAASTRFEQLYCCDSPSRHSDWRSIEVDYFVAITLYPSARTRARMQVRLPFTLLTAPPPDRSYSDAPSGPHRDPTNMPSGQPASTTDHVDIGACSRPADTTENQIGSQWSSLRKKRAPNELGASLKHVQFDAAQNSEYTAEQLEEWQRYYATYGYPDYTQNYSEQYGAACDQSAPQNANAPVADAPPENWQPNAGDQSVAPSSAAFVIPTSHVQLQPEISATPPTPQAQMRIQAPTASTSTPPTQSGGRRSSATPSGKSESVRRRDPREQFIRELSFQNQAAELSPEDDEIKFAQV